MASAGETIARLRAQLPALINEHISAPEHTLREIVLGVAGELNELRGSERRPNNIAHYLAQHPEELAALEHLVGEGKKFGFQGIGDRALALSFENSQGERVVLRLTQHQEIAPPNVPSILQSERGEFRGISMSVSKPALPLDKLVDEGVITAAEAEAINKRMGIEAARDGLVYTDAHPGNVGMASDGSMAIIDPGAVATETAERARLPEHFKDTPSMADSFIAAIDNNKKLAGELPSLNKDVKAAPLVTDFLSSLRPASAAELARYGADLFEHSGAIDAAAAGVAAHLLEGKLAGAAGKVVKVAAPILVGIAIAGQADAAELAVKNNQLPKEAVTGYMALVTAGVMAGVADPSFGAASDVATHKAFQAFADKYNLSAEARNALDPSISGMLNQQLTPQQQRFLSHASTLPDKPDATYPAGVNQLIAINNQMKAIADARSQPGNGMPIDPSSPEGAAQRQQNEHFAQLQAEYAKTYVAAANGDPKFLTFLDQQAATHAQIAQASQDPKLRQEADTAFDKLPTVPGPNDSPSTRRLIEARNKLRERMAELEKAEKNDTRPGSLTYYGQQNDKAVEQYYQAFAKEKANPAEPAADPMAGVTPSKKNVTKMKIDHPAMVAGNDKVEKKEPTNQDNKPIKVAAANAGRAAGPV